MKARRLYFRESFLIWTILFDQPSFLHLVPRTQSAQQADGSTGALRSLSHILLGVRRETIVTENLMY